MKLLYKFTITICFLLIAFSCKGLNKESDQFYKKTAYGLQHHSCYIPILTMDSTYCVIENSWLYDIVEDRYGSIKNYSRYIYQSLRKNGIVNVPFYYKEHKEELKPVYPDLTIPGVDITDISAIIKTCFNANGCMKEQYMGTKCEGLIIDILYLHRVAVTTDCETGCVIIDD